jgi:crotonobetainyl-CoA:carnitine CoA-transferase CaiB-like acyl-CoA transferase
LSSQAAGPLAGIRILDLARLGPGPHSSQILGDFGAEIITIEPPPKNAKALKMPRGAPIRRNTRSITLNLKHEKGLEIFRSLVGQSDVVVEGFRPGVAKRLGIDQAALQEIKPDIISVSLSGFGQSGPYSQVVGHDINYQAMAGILHLTGDRDGPPRIPGNAIADNAGGIAAALAILVAIIARDRSGVGQAVDVAMIDTLLTMMLLNLNQAVESGVSARRGETLLTGAYPFYEIYECADGKHVAVGAIEPWFYANLCRLLGREDFIEDQRAEGAVRDERFRIFREIFRTRTRDEWVARLMFEETCVTPVYSLEEVAADPQLRERGSIVEAEDLDGGRKTQVGLLFGLSQTPGAIRRPPPEIGADTAPVLRELGYDESKIEAMAEAGAF